MTFADLPLFASDCDIAEAVLGPGEDSVRVWSASVAALEACGFPKPVRLYGKRYTPAVLAFYEHTYGFRPDTPAGAPAKTMGDLAREGHERRRQELLARKSAAEEKRRIALEDQKRRREERLARKSGR